MRCAVFSAAMLIATATAAHSQAAADLASIFEAYCATAAPEHPACGNDLIGTPAYKWLLVADSCDHDRSPAYCARFQTIRARTEPCVVAYSHRFGRWRARHALETRERWAFDTDVNGMPTIVVSRSDHCAAIVEDTKPLNYGIQLGKIEEKDTPLVEGLKELAELLGATAQMAAARQGMRSQPQQRDAGVFDELAAAVWALSRALWAIADLKAEVVAALNAAEVSETGTLTAVDWKRASLDAAVWHKQFEVVRAMRIRAVDSLGGQPPADQQRPILEQAQKVLDRQPDIVKTIAALAAARQRWNQFVVGARMMTWMPVLLRRQTIQWTKDQVHPFTIIVDTPFPSDVTTRRPKIDTSVRFTSPRASMFGIAAGLVITPLEQITYKAVAGSDGVKRITATERDGRTGQLGLFIDWRLVQLWHAPASAWRMRPALQAGVAVDTDTPGVFLGGSVDAVKWLRLSGGRTWQSLTVLDGQEPGDEVEDDNSIRRRDRFRSGWYMSVSVAIDGLPIFNAR